MKLINLQAQLTNPFVRDCFWHLGNVWWTFGQYWIVELEHAFYPRSLIEIDICVTINEDHQGFEFIVGAFGYSIHLHLYDMRHHAEEE